MKKLTLRLFLYLHSILAGGLMAQVTLDIPYKTGDIRVKAKLKYGPSVKKADSVRLEYKTTENFILAERALGRPKEILQKASMKHRFEAKRTYRAIVYMKGQDAIYSNEVVIYYKPEIKYTKEGLPPVAGLKGEVIEKSDGNRYVRLSWTPIPKAFGYRLYQKSTHGNHEMVWDVSQGDAGYIFDNKHDFFIGTRDSITFNFAVGAVEGPADNSDTKKLSNLYTIDVPSAYQK